jgi:hypothetical protein
MQDENAPAEYHPSDQPVRPLTEIAGSVKRMLEIIAEITELSQGPAAMPDRVEQMSLPMEEP